ncbi:hypothetical protein AOQ73_18355 [Bradyrhizobium pachyrhizi]|nr:hypothetical protein AOQ73_18355 [Bradyrhizobium pachyrhizi]
MQLTGHPVILPDVLGNYLRRGQLLLNPFEHDGLDVGAWHHALVVAQARLLHPRAQQQRAALVVAADDIARTTPPALDQSRQQVPGAGR